MPVASALAYIKSLLNGLPMPGGIPDLVAYITPPAVDDEPNGEPRAYVWTSAWQESRNPQRGGTVNRALAMPQPGQSANSGTKPLDHQVHVWIIYDDANDDPQGDSLFPGILDAVSWKLRVSQDPVTVTDPYTNLTSVLIDVGESIDGQVSVTALAGQRMYRYDSLMIVSVLELIQA